MDDMIIFLPSLVACQPPHWGELPSSRIIDPLASSQAQPGLSLEVGSRWALDFDSANQLDTLNASFLLELISAYTDGDKDKIPK